MTTKTSSHEFPTVSLQVKSWMKNTLRHWPPFPLTPLFLTKSWSGTEEQLVIWFSTLKCGRWIANAYNINVESLKIWILILIGILIPLVLVETLWWCQAFQHNYFTYFPDRYMLSITMVWHMSCLQVLLWSVEIFGAMVAGMTSEGGGAVAFPVNTHCHPTF